MLQDHNTSKVDVRYPLCMARNLFQIKSAHINSNNDFNTSNGLDSIANNTGKQKYGDKEAMVISRKVSTWMEPLDCIEVEAETLPTNGLPKSINVACKQNAIVVLISRCPTLNWLWT